MSRELINAASTGQIDSVNLLLAEGADVDYIHNHRTALMEAASKGYADIVNSLIRHGANVNAVVDDGLLFTNSQGITALMTAARSNNRGLIDLLLKNGADINFQDNSGNTALMIAVRNNCPIAIRTLLDRGADINLRDKNGNTPLLIAAMIGNLSIIKELLKINPRAASHNPEITVSQETSSDNTQIATLDELLNFSDNNSVTSDPNVEALLTEWFNHEKSIAPIVRSYINTTDTKGRTPLMIAASYGHFDIVDFLITKGADVEAKDNNGDDAYNHALLGPDIYYSATLYKRYEAIRILEKHMSPTPAQLESRAALMAAIFGDDYISKRPKLSKQR